MKEDTASGSRIRILLVGDSPEQRRDLISALDDPRLEIVQVDTGQEGLDLIRTGLFAVILIDVRIPGMDVFELAERIRKLEQARMIPIIFLTATQPPDSHIRKGYALGSVDFLIVPVIPEIFRAKMEYLAETFQSRERQALHSLDLEDRVKERSAELVIRDAVTKTITDNAASGLFLLDKDGRITFMNPAAETALGRTFEQVKGRTLHDVAHPEGFDGKAGPETVCLLTKALESGSPIKNLGEIFTHSTGLPMAVSCSISPLQPAGRQAGTVVEFQDVTEQNQAAEKLKHSEDRYRRLFETAQDGILILDAEAGRIQDVNPFLAELLGYSGEELIGKELWEIGLFGDIGANRQAFLTLQQEGFLRYDDLPLLTKGGIKKEVEFVSNVYKVGTGNVVQCNIRDVTDRKRTEAALHRSEEDLRQAQKTEALGKLSGGIAHDFNNLLTAINGYSDLCLSINTQGGAMQEYLGEILKAGNRAAGLTQQLLAFSRKQVLAPKILNLSATVTDILSLLRRLIGENIRLTTVLEPDLGLVRADPVQMQQVLLNLAVNARDALPKGGEIIITTGNGVTDKDPAKSGKDGHAFKHVLLSVSDNGLGMNAEVLARLFEPFYTTKDFGKGSGMGLATVDGIVKQSGGRIKVESAPGKGTTFTIYLARVEGAEAEVDPPPVPRSEDALGTETILLAEDDSIVRTFTRRTLEIHGYKVLEAQNGEEALAISSKSKGSIDLLLTDILMPGVNGRDLAIRFREENPDTPVLFMSGYTDEIVDSLGLLEEGAQLIQKPFTPAYLIEVVMGALQAKLQKQ